MPYPQLTQEQHLLVRNEPCIQALFANISHPGGPTADVEAFWQQVQGSSPVEGMQGFFSFRASLYFIQSISVHFCCSNPQACGTQLDVTISFGGTAWPINSADMNLGAISEGSEQCMGGIFDVSTGANIGNGNGPDWIVGDTFLVSFHLLAV
jgi:cathepsin D